MEKDVGLSDLVECGLETLDKESWQLSDEADGVGEQEGDIADDDLSDGGVESGEKLILGEDLGFGERVHERALSDIGVADERDSYELAAVLALCRHLSVDMSELLLEERNAVEDNTPVGLDLLLARASHADATLLPLEVGPEACESGEKVLVLSEFDLGLGVGCARPAGEDVENE